MWYTADVLENIRKGVAYGFGDEEATKEMSKFQWPVLKKKRDAYIKRLNGI